MRILVIVTYLIVQATAADDRPNLLFIMVDQLRFDVVRYMQDRLPEYEGVRKVSTPNIDNLARQGVVFETTYCAAPVCVPSRVSLRTGCSVGRTGVGTNGLAYKAIFGRQKIFRERIQALRSFEQILVEERGYTAESYGKWHVPFLQYYKPDIKTRRPNSQVIAHNFFDFETKQWKFYKDMFPHKEGAEKRFGKKAVDWFQLQQQFLVDKDGVKVAMKKGWQHSEFSDFPYKPIQLDSRYGLKTDYRNGKGEKYEDSRGVDGLPAKYSRTSVLGQMAVLALDRLAKERKPFSLSVHHYSPHPPMIASPEYFGSYYNNRDELLTAPSIKDTLENSPYKYLWKKGSGYHNPDKMSELTACYYAMVEEVDNWIGKLLDKLAETGLKSSTLVIFTSDHGEKLGAHGLISKDGFLEEEARVPMILSYPGYIPSGATVKDPVSHLDVFSTILDYLGASEHDKSDGKSLRRFIQPQSNNFNQLYDEGTVVVELQKRTPNMDGTLNGKLGAKPSFMIRKGGFKLILPRKADSKTLDALYNLERDPFEMKNLLGKNGNRANPNIVGKAEHLKILLLEWMRRKNGRHGFYSSNRWQGGQGRGDMKEIHLRRTWRRAAYWQSDSVLRFGNPVLVNGVYRRNEFLYIGRTLPGKLIVKSVRILGPDAKLFRLNVARFQVNTNGYQRIKISFSSRSPVQMDSLRARIEVRFGAKGFRLIPIRT